MGGGLLAFLHPMLCARPGLGSGPFPLSTLSFWLVWLQPLLLTTKCSHSRPTSPPAPSFSPTSSTPLGCFPHRSCQQRRSSTSPNQRTLQLLSPLLIHPRAWTMIYRRPATPSSFFSNSDPGSGSSLVSVTPIHPVSLYTWRGHEALAGQICLTVLYRCGWRCRWKQVRRNECSEFKYFLHHEKQF